MISYQKRAVALGGNAVVNLKSVYKGNLVASDTEYERGVGTATVGVSFTGSIVKLAQ